MHLHFPFTALQVLWTLTFAAHLVLLVVLMGRDRIARFPWFTASIALVALRLLSSRLLFGRMPQMTLSAVFIVMADLGAIIGLMVILELARRAFGRVRRTTWVTGALVLMAVGAAVLALWGPWPAWKTLTAKSTMSTLQLLQLIAQKASLLVDVETIALGLLIVTMGRRFGAGFRTHTQKIMIGLSTASIAQLTMQAVWETIARTAVAHTMADYERIVGIREKLFNTNSVVYLAVLIWWIVWLWVDEPGTTVEAPVRTELSGSSPGGADAVVESAIETIPGEYGPGTESPSIDRP
jgi:hypothetical protein